MSTFEQDFFNDLINSQLNTPTEIEESENFSEILSGERIHASSSPEDFEEEYEDEDTPEPTKSDPFTIEKPQRNWLQHGLTHTTSMKKKKRGRPKGSKNVVHQRHKAQREAIQIMTAAGIKKVVMAKLMKISYNTLVARFPEEMEHGDDILKARIVNVFIQKALDGNIPAILHFLKSKTEMREIESDDKANENARLSDVERNQRLMALFMANPELREKVRQRQLNAPPIDIEKVESEVKKDIFDVS